MMVRKYETKALPRYEARNEQDAEDQRELAAGEGGPLGDAPDEGIVYEYDEQKQGQGGYGQVGHRHAGRVQDIGPVGHPDVEDDGQDQSRGEGPECDYGVWRSCHTTSMGSGMA